MTDPAEKLALIRAEMKDSGLDVYIITDSDPHLSGYVPDHWRVIAWLTGFTGSAATVIITHCFAGLWTDSRYFIQAEEQLTGSGISMMKSGPKDRDGFRQWLFNNLERGSRIGVDGRTISISRLKNIMEACSEKNFIFDIDSDLIKELWSDRPALPLDQAFDHPVAFSGVDRSEKITQVREAMSRLGAEYHILSSPDDIMWLLNIRGRDVLYNPVLLSFAVAGMDQILLFADEDKIPGTIAREFDKLGIVILPYEEVAGVISTLRTDSCMLLSPGATSAAIYNSIHPGTKIKEDISIPARLKSVKNKTEIRNLGNAMIKDGVALTRFFYWIEMSNGTAQLSELSVAEKLKQFRSEQENFLDLSFASIVAFNEHAALPHYNASIETNRIIDRTGLLLVDSGSHYLDGTTDITRTIALGKATEKQKRDFTLVLKGTINLAMAVFPSETFGFQLDVLARRSLWENGLNYGHGTGHGVGYCLNVHEGPQNISPVPASDPESYLRPGMLISDEPGIYRKGEYGIRIENLILCYEDEETEFGRFLKFDTITLCYIDTSLIISSLLSQKETDWLNRYHSDVYEKISPHLNEKEKSWLREKTKAIKGSA